MKINLFYSPLRLYFSKKSEEINTISEMENENKAKNVIVTSYEENDIKILLVEDNKASQNLISSLLRKEQYQVDIVKNGWEAICAFEACKYDLILMNINMPVLNGDEATIAIRKTNKQLPIIALTDAICEDIFEDKLYMGFNDVIPKPINTELLLTTVRNFITLSKRSIQEENTFDSLTWAS